MKKGSSIDDSLEFCKEIKYYENKDDPMEFDEKNYPKLKEYIHWMKNTDEKVHEDYESYKEVLEEVEKESEEVLKEQAINKNDLDPFEEEHEEATTTVSEEEALDMLFEDEKPEKESLFKGIIQIAACLIVAFALVYGITTYVATYTRVNGESMETTLRNQDVVLIDRLSYRMHDPKQFDVIVFENDNDVNLVKRIIALPGQTVQIVEGLIYVDGDVVNESYGTAKMTTSGLAADKLTLGQGEYFVLGDNRNNSTDSRSSYVGMVKRETIVGKVFFRIFPFTKVGQIE